MAGSMLRSVNASICVAHWLTDADKGAVQQARDYAKAIDEAAGSGDPEYADKVLGWMGPYLTGVLKQLGCTPEGRKNLAVEAKAVKGRLAELRAIRDDSRSA